MNEYLARYREAVADGSSHLKQLGLAGSVSEDLLRDIGAGVARDRLVREFSWAVPSTEALDVIAGLSPVVEVGAGGGYWAMLLRAHGAQIEPFDPYPDPAVNAQISRMWLAVREGGTAEALTDGREHWTLMLCWPTYGDRWAAGTLKLHRGEHVCYIGELGGACATSEFFDLLAARYTCVRTVQIPQWPNMKDSVTVWKRRPQTA